MTFAEAHPYVLEDGRRFASLACAARAAVHTQAVQDERNGMWFRSLELQVLVERLNSAGLADLADLADNKHKGDKR